MSVTTTYVTNAMYAATPCKSGYMRITKDNQKNFPNSKIGDCVKINSAEISYVLVTTANQSKYPNAKIGQIVEVYNAVKAKTTTTTSKTATTTTTNTTTKPTISYPKVSNGNILMIPTGTNSSINSLLVEGYDIDYKPFQKSWEFFKAVEGQQVIEKQCDDYPELKCKVLVAPDVLTSYIYDGAPRVPEYNEEFETIRESLFMDYEGCTMVFSSPSFPVFTGVIDKFSYAIESGDKDAVYDLEIMGVV